MKPYVGMKKRQIDLVALGLLSPHKAAKAQTSYAEAIAKDGSVWQLCPQTLFEELGYHRPYKTFVCIAIPANVSGNDTLTHSSIPIAS